MQIFISYRRDDSAATARLIHNELCRYFGADDIFMDAEDIGWGDDFGSVIERHIARADVIVIVIGPHWTRFIEERERGDDWVRHEVRAALARQAQGRARVLPVLVCGATPPATALPPDIDALRRLDMREIRDRELKVGIEKLIEAVQEESFQRRAQRLASSQRARRAAAVLGLAVFLASWLALFELLGMDTRMHALTMRLAHALPGAPPPAWSGGVVIVAIDEQAVAAVGRPFGPGWRAEMARVVNQVAAAGARTLALDITFTTPANPAADAALERSLAAASGRLPVVVAVQDLVQGAPALLPRLQPHVTWGVACLGQRQGRAYTLPLVLRRGTGESARLWPSFGLAAYSGGAWPGDAGQFDALALQLPVVRGSDGATVTVQAFGAETLRQEPAECSAMQPGDLVAHQLLDGYAVPPLDGPGQRVSFAEVLRGDAAALQALRGRIVLVGLTAGTDDRHRTLQGTHRGVELIAAQVNALQRGQALRPLPPLVQALLMLAMAVAAAAVGATLHGRRRRWAWPAVAVLALAWGLGGVLWYRSEQQLVELHYGWLALALGAALARRMTRSER
ncbi:CHASE2 domain-containing protein [uncultured Azohydromonas sp.]|jgi:Predicted transmembrane sensor domain|uniref:CHASE2 domain-containing protein n=1 Tax=uncultured Azohydromonas sp. TaxID=487342 RepID=UPI002622E3B7|nr:CHASE2 domain-containing protein [uncultured Azohydromonas sp.]